MSWELLLPKIINILEYFLLLLVPALAAWIGKKLNNQKMANKLETDLTDIITVLLENAKKDVENPNTSTKTINLKDNIIPDAKLHVNQLNQKEIKKLKINEDELDNFIKKKLRESGELEKVKHLVEDETV